MAVTELEDSIKLPWGTAVQVKKTKYGYIYRVSGPDFPPIYEVFERRSVAVCLDFEKRLYSETEKKEIYPKSNDFGTWAYSYKAYNAAIISLDAIDNKAKQKESAR